MSIIERFIDKIYWLAAITILLGLILMSLGNSIINKPYGFISLTLAPILLVLGYVLTVIGIMKRKV